MKKNILVPKTLAIFLLLTIAGLVGVSVMVYQDGVETKHELEQLKSQIRKENKSGVIRELKALLSADSLFFAGDGSQAITQYQTLIDRDSFPDKDMLKKRIAYAKSRTDGKVKNIVSDNSVLPASVAGIVPDTVLLLKEQTASTKQKIEKVKDSLGTKISELNRKVRDRERALKKKEELRALILESTEGASIHYVGETQNEMANGQGTGIWQNSGGVYKGTWVNNRRHGRGVYTWSDGIRYEGEYRDDKREGRGTYTWLSGERYEGVWKDNKRHGAGTLYNKDGNISFEGMWEDDKPKRN